MADEFIKGFAILTAGFLLWMTFASWFNTPEFAGAQLTGPNPTDPDTYTGVALIVKSAAFWFMILGPLTFWVLIPGSRRVRTYYANKQ
jgi:hypothetical protein